MQYTKEHQIRLLAEERDVSLNEASEILKKENLLEQIDEAKDFHQLRKATSAMFNYLDSNGVFDGIF